MNGVQPLAPEAMCGQKLGKYKIHEVVGVGEKGSVFRAYDASMERDVAIRVLTERLAADEFARSRFLFGAQSAGKFNHINTVTVHEVAQDDNVSYLVMELVSGGNAREHLQRHGAFSVTEATRMVIEASRGLAAAHQAGFVHRDIKPSNLLLMEDGTVKVSDFQLAKQTAVSSSRNLTLAGQVIGTPHYMSPEQCQAKTVDARSDIYSLGATYYSLLTGRRPYEDRTTEPQIMLAHLTVDPPDPRQDNAEVPDACAQIVEQSMATQPDQRYQSMEEFQSDLEVVAEAIRWGCV